MSRAPSRRRRERRAPLSPEAASTAEAAPTSAAESPAKRKAPKGRQTLLKRFVSWRRATQLLLGLAVYFAVAKLGISLWWVIGVGSLAGVVLGKFFCRWMCPLGFMMETMMGMDASGKQASLYQYFKVGCPIAWAGGALNRISALRVKRNANPCASCDRCDEACYIVTNNRDYSLWRDGAKNPSTHFACSRCLQCVSACPTGRITVGLPTDARDAA